MIEVNTILEEFGGDLSIQDIYTTTRKELEYLRLARRESNKNRTAFDRMR